MMEKIENLDYNLRVYQDSEMYAFTSDAVLLAKFVVAKKNAVIVDLGTGSGIISLYLAKKFNPKRIYGIEIQEKMAEMAKKSVKLNNLEDIIEIINEDMKKISLKADIVVSNPPYKKLSPFVNLVESKAIARHEICINLDELVNVANSILETGGKFFVCYDADRSAELIYKLKKSGLEPKRIMFTQSRKESDASLVFVEAVKGGKEGIRVMPVLITNDSKGKYIENLEVKN